MFKRDHKFKIVIEAKHPDQMLHPTGSDYREISLDEVHIDIVDTGNWKMNALLGIHGFIEYLLVKALGVPVNDIEEHDSRFEEERKMGMHDSHAEPGDAIEAPNHIPHSIATGIERIAACFLRVHWSDYSSVVDCKCLPRITKHQKGVKRR